MLFWIFVIALVIGIVCYIVGAQDYDTEWLEGIGATLAILMGGAIIISGVVLSVTYIGVDADLAQYQQEYKSLTYQLENNVYDNDNDIGKKELYEQVQKWNENLACSKALQDNFWVGIYYPDIYDQLEFIEYPNADGVEEVDNEQREAD